MLEPTFPCYFGLTALKRMNFVIHFFLIMIGVICRIQCYLFRVNEREADCKKGLFPFVEPECEERSLNITVIPFGKCYSIYMKTIIKHGQSKFLKIQTIIYGNFHFVVSQYSHLETRQLINSEKLDI